VAAGQLYRGVLSLSLMGNLVSSKQESPPPLPRVISSSRWELRARPNGLVSVDDFALQEQIEIDTELDEGEALVQVEMLSVDAFLRTMLDEKAYHGAISLGDTLPALGYGRVIASASPKLRPGSRVMGMLVGLDAQHRSASSASLSRGDVLRCTPAVITARVVTAASSLWSVHAGSARARSPS